MKAKSLALLYLLTGALAGNAVVFTTRYFYQDWLIASFAASFLAFGYIVGKYKPRDEIRGGLK